MHRAWGKQSDNSTRFLFFLYIIYYKTSSYRRATFLTPKVDIRERERERERERPQSERKNKSATPFYTAHRAPEPSERCPKHV